MAETMTRDELLHEILQAKIEWEVTTTPLVAGDQDERPVVGEWRVKDIRAHLTWHERQMLEFLQAGRFTGSDWWNLPLNERNRLIFEDNRNRSADDVREESRDVHEALVKMIETLTDEQLNDPAQWPGMPAEWQPWDVIAGNTYRHYQDHTSDLKKLIPDII